MTAPDSRARADLAPNLATAGIIAAAALVPFAAIASAILGIIAMARRANPLVGYAAVGLVTALFAWSNLGKSVAGDWFWYTQHYIALRDLPLNEYFGMPIAGVAASAQEPLYYAASSILSRLTSANVGALSVVVTCMIYIPAGVALVRTASPVARSPMVLLTATVTAMLMGITFTLSNQLVRQEIAAAFIGLAIVLAGSRRYVAMGAMLAAAILTHNSALIPAAGLLIALFLARSGRGPFLRIVLSGALFIGLGRYYLVTQGNSTYEGKSDGSVSPIVIGLDLLVLAVFAFLCLRRGLLENAIARTVLMCTPALFGFVIGVASQPIPLLRMYFYIEVLRSIMLCFIVIYAMQHTRWSAALGVALVISALLYVQWRVVRSPFVYEMSPLALLLQSPLLSPLMHR